MASSSSNSSPTPQDEMEPVSDDMYDTDTPDSYFDYLDFLDENPNCSMSYEEFHEASIKQVELDIQQLELKIKRETEILRSLERKYVIKAYSIEQAKLELQHREQLEHMKKNPDQYDP